MGPRLTCDVLIQTWIKFPFMYGLPLSHHDQKLQLHNLDAEAADVPHPPFLSSITLSALVIVQASLLESVSCLLLYTYNCSIRECTTLNPLHTAIPGLRTSFYFQVMLCPLSFVLSLRRHITPTPRNPSIVRCIASYLYPIKGAPNRVPILLAFFISPLRKRFAYTTAPQSNLGIFTCSFELISVSSPFGQRNQAS